MKLSHELPCLVVRGTTYIFLPSKIDNRSFTQGGVSTDTICMNLIVIVYDKLLT